MRGLETPPRSREHRPEADIFIGPPRSSSDLGVRKTSPSSTEHRPETPYFFTPTRCFAMSTAPPPRGGTCAPRLGGPPGGHGLEKILRDPRHLSPPGPTPGTGAGDTWSNRARRRLAGSIVGLAGDFGPNTGCDCIRFVDLSSRGRSVHRAAGLSIIHKLPGHREFDRIGIDDVVDRFFSMAARVLWKTDLCCRSTPLPTK